MAKNKLAHHLETFGLDWSAVGIDPDQWMDLELNTRLKPQDFLAYAEQDLASKTTRGYVNCVSNAKRAIDCQIDGSIEALGFPVDGLRSFLHRDALAFVEGATAGSSLPITFRFLQSFGVLTPAVVDRVRRLRHSLEHKYVPPTRRRATEALEIAMLFVRAAERSLMGLPESFGVGAGISTKEPDLYLHEVFFTYEAAEAARVSVRFWSRDVPRIHPSPEVEVQAHHASYFFFLRLVFALRDGRGFQDALRDFIRSTGARLDTAKIRYVPRISKWRISG